MGVLLVCKKVGREVLDSPLGTTPLLSDARVLKTKRSSQPPVLESHFEVVTDTSSYVRLEVQCKALLQ
jgi:hypothetical protein